jgi:signal transduction histidine kinase
VKAVQLLHDIRRDLTTTVADTRRLVRGLRPPALDELGLAGAIRGVVAEFGGDGDGVPAIVIEADELPDLPAAVEVAAFRIAQESLTNAVRHANAEQIQVRLALQHDEALRIEVLDDGTGFDPADNAGVGMQAMRERVEELGGDISIGRAPSGGTSVLAILPLSPG